MRCEYHITLDEVEDMLRIDCVFLRCGYAKPNYQSIGCSVEDCGYLIDAEKIRWFFMDAPGTGKNCVANSYGDIMTNICKVHSNMSTDMNMLSNSTMQSKANIHQNINPKQNVVNGPNSMIGIVYEIVNSNVNNSRRSNLRDLLVRKSDKSMVLEFDKVEKNNGSGRAGNCIVCASEDSDVMCYPCGHICVCRGCEKEGRIRRCPICMVEVDEFKKFHFA